MTQPIKVKVDFDSETTQALLHFISDTQEGKYTEKKPHLTQTNYRRMQIPEQDALPYVEDNNTNEILLFGVSY